MVTDVIDKVVDDFQDWPLKELGSTLFISMGSRTQTCYCFQNVIANQLNYFNFSI